MLKDTTGLSVTANNQDAVDAFERTLISYFRFGIDIGKNLKETYSKDENMFFAHILRGYFMHLMGSRKMLPKAENALLAAQRHEKNLTEREILHLRSLEAWCKLDLRKTTSCWQNIVDNYPQDALAIKMLHYSYFYLGDLENLKLSVENSWEYWDHNKESSYYGYLLSLKAFGLEENGYYKEAEDLAYEAYYTNKDDAWAVHTISHVYEMNDQSENGIDWIKKSFLPDKWNNFKYHLQWHKALMSFNSYTNKEILNIYDNDVFDIDSEEYLDLINNISLLFRLEILNANVENRWNHIYNKIKTRLDDNLLAFIDIHFMICLCFNDIDNAKDYLKNIKKYQDSANDTYTEISKTITFTLCEAIVSYRTNNFNKCILILEEVLDKSYLIGGSNAQRDILNLMLFDSLLKTKNNDKIQNFLNIRTISRPNNKFCNKLQELYL